MSYEVGLIPSEGEDLTRFLKEELDKISLAFGGVNDLDTLFTPPLKPRDGMIRKADGVNWNPGAGAGVYCYYAGVWNKLG